MTIGYILDDTLDKSDGVQQAVILIGEKMRSLGHDVHYIVAHTERTDLKNIHSVGNFFSVRFNGNSVRTPLPASSQKIRELFINYKFDVLHVQMPFSPFLASKVLKMAPTYVLKVGTFHILPYNQISKYGTRAVGIALKKTIQTLDKCFAVSKPANDFMEYAFSLQGKIIPNPVDYEKFSSKKRIAKNLIVYVGRFDERKGVRELIHAYSDLKNDLRENYSLVMCGSGPLLEDMKSLAKTLKVKVDFPGFISEDDKIQYLTDADIKVLPSISGESFGIVLTEAMSAGNGITIGGDNPGYRSVLEDWPETLFDPKDISVFTKTLEKFLEDEKKAKSIAKEQKKNVKQYDINVVAKNLLREYNLR